MGGGVMRIKYGKRGAKLPPVSYYDSAEVGFRLIEISILRLHIYIHRCVTLMQGIETPCFNAKPSYL